MKKLLFAFLLLSVGCSSKKEDAAPTPSSTFDNQPVTINITPATGSSYTLSEGKITYAQYDAIRILNAQGKLSDGKLILLRFGTSTSALPNQTNVFSASIDGVSVLGPTGGTTYNQANKTVSGDFSCTLTGGGTLKGSIPSQAILTR